jgi:hypothetical protein
MTGWIYCSNLTRLRSPESRRARRARDEPGAKFSGIVAGKCRFGGGHFVAGVRVGQRPAPDDKRE